MRKARFASMIALFCGVVTAGGAFAAEQVSAPAAGDAAVPAKAEVKEAPKAAGRLESIFTKLDPKFGGDANIEYDTRDSNFGDGLTSRVRLTMDAQIDPRIYLHTRLTAKQYVYGNEHKDRPSQAAGYENEAIKVGMEQLYLGSKLGPKYNDTEIRIGRQPLWIANGMLADINGINGVYLRTSLLGVNALGFFGREGTQALPEVREGKSSNLAAFEVSRAFGPVELGASYLKVDEAFWGVNASYATPFKAVLFGQYVKNKDAAVEDTGYRAGVSYGNAAKQGEWDASLAYLKVENSINPNGKYFVNDGNWVGAKGFRAKVHYALSDWSTLVLVQDLFDTTRTGERHNRTDIEFEVRF